MPVGIQIKGQHGYFQIDGQFQNSCLVAAGTASTSSNAVVINSGAGRVAPVIATRSPDSPLTFLDTQVQADGSYNYIIYSEAASATFDWWIYAEIPATDPGSGIMIKNTAGEIIFVSGRKYLRQIAGPITIDVNAFPTSGTPANIWTGPVHGGTRKFGIIQSIPGIRRRGGGTSSGQFGGGGPMAIDLTAVGPYQWGVDYGFWGRRFAPISTVDGVERTIDRHPVFYIVETTGHDSP